MVSGIIRPKIKLKYDTLKMIRFRRYQPRFSDPRRSILFHNSPRKLDCTDFVPVLNDPELLSYYLTVFPNVTEIYDNSFRLTFRRGYYGFEDVRIECLSGKAGLWVEEAGIPRGIPSDWDVEVVSSV